MTAKQKKMRNRILIALGLFVLLFIMEKAGVFEPLPTAVPFVLFLIPYLIAGYDVILRAAKNIRNGQVFDENFLMTIATFAAFALQEYPEAAAVMLFYQVGELFQGVAVGKSRQSITQMMEIAPETANLETAEGIREVDPEEVAVGSILIVRPGEKIPIDAEVIEGESFLDTKALTGENVPRKASVGDTVISGCVNGEGTLRIKTLKAYEDSTVAKILDLVENASDKKARLENFITRFARIYTPVVTIGAVLLAFVPPLILGDPFKTWVLRACTFLIVSCPCALVISVPLGFFGGIGAASKQGIMVKGSNFLEAAAHLNTIVFDKTGTLTKGEFKVSRLFLPEGMEKEQEAHLLETAALAESYSTHPIAKSILEAYGKPVSTERVHEVKEVAGKGVSAVIDARAVLAGNERLLTDNGITVPTLPADCLAGTVVHVAEDGNYLGAILITDTVKTGAKEAIASLKRSGITRTVMLTGDHQPVAEAVAKELAIDEVHTELLPQEKLEALERIIEDNESNMVAFVGDGVNDAPVLMRADVGLAMGSMGSDAAIEAADIVLMDDDITKIARLLQIAKKTMSVVKQNIVFAIGVKVLILLLGALGLANLWMAVFADVGVAVIAILNSMRMLRY